MKACPPPLVFAIRTLPAWTFAHKLLPDLAATGLEERATGRPEVKLPDLRLHGCSMEPAIQTFTLAELQLDTVAAKKRGD